jgi:sugar phosphate isomerase/epimerase
VIATETSTYSGLESEREVPLGRLRKSLEQMVDYADNHQAVVAIEPVATHTLNTPKLAAQILSEFPQLRIVFDPVNLLTSENIGNQEKLWDECFSLFGDKIKAIHIKDVDASLGDLPLGQGIVNFKALAKGAQAVCPDAPLLREGITFGSEAEEIQFIRETFSEKK